MSKSEKEKQKYIQDKCHQILNELLRDEDNKYCVDCDAKGPRWASWNLGIFLCIRCAGIHRNLGVHISKVKSINLDAWTPEQIGYIQAMGNSKARAVYEANLPDNFRRPQVDSALETFIRAKYEQKKYIAKEWVPPSTPPPAFNVDEEKKREKELRLKKNKQNLSTNQELQTNPLPRPISSPATTVINAGLIADTSSSPKMNHKSPSLSAKVIKESNDLLGLDSLIITNDNLTMDKKTNDGNDDDLFDAFVSAPVVNNDNTPSIGQDLIKDKSNELKELKIDDSDFFNQKQPEEKKLDKDSIMKLYESNSSSTLFNSPFNLNTDNAIMNNFNQQQNLSATNQFMLPTIKTDLPIQIANLNDNSNLNLFHNGHPIAQPYFPPATNPFLASSLPQQNLQTNDLITKQQQQQQAFNVNWSTLNNNQQSNINTAVNPFLADTGKTLINNQMNLSGLNNTMSSLTSNTIDNNQWLFNNTTSAANTNQSNSNPNPVSFNLWQ